MAKETRAWRQAGRRLRRARAKERVPRLLLNNILRAVLHFIFSTLSSNSVCHFKFDTCDISWFHFSVFSIRLLVLLNFPTQYLLMSTPIDILNFFCDKTILPRQFFYHLDSSSLKIVSASFKFAHVVRYDYLQSLRRNFTFMTCAYSKAFSKLISRVFMSLF